MRKLSFSLLVILLVVCALLLWQNRQSEVELAILGRILGEMSLAVALGWLYLVGLGLGLLLFGSWAFEDAFARRRLKRQLNDSRSETPFEPQTVQEDETLTALEEDDYPRPFDRDSPAIRPDIVDDEEDSGWG